MSDKNLLFMDGEIHVTIDGVDREYIDSDIIPAWLAVVLQARVLAQDPACGAIVFNASEPGAPYPGEVWTGGNGQYQQWAGAAWKPVTVQFPDGAYRQWGNDTDPYTMAIMALNIFMAQTSPQEWEASWSTGGQSASHGSYADYMAWMKARIAFIKNMEEKETGVTGEGYASFESKPVGSY
ncbi:hypothetical protein AGMMS49940_15300 [Spirochaetia bacterium]|nr:hypothetical protein AGMMS49940_15300 [Spirochaetia bacterium]